MNAAVLKLWDYEAYAGLPTDGQRYEIIDGELLVSPAPSTRHQTVSRRLQFKLYVLYEETGKGAIFNAPCDVILAPGTPGTPATIVQPDLVLVLLGSQAEISKRGIEGPPDLLVEILSNSTARVDLRTKRALYASHGVREYWIVDPEDNNVEVNTEPSGGFRNSTLYGSNDTLKSPLLPDLALPLRDIFK